jgi:hypothetical protein
MKARELDGSTQTVEWSNEDEAFDLDLENFGVDTCALQEIPTVPARVFRCWVEPWEEELCGMNDVVARTKLLEKYKDIVFYCPDDQITYTAYDQNLYWHKGRHNGWCVLGVPPDWDGVEMDDLEPFVIRSNIMGEMIMDTNQPQSLNVTVLKVPEDDDNSES